MSLLAAKSQRPAVAEGRVGRQGVCEWDLEADPGMEFGAVHQRPTGMLARLHGVLHDRRGGREECKHETHIPVEGEKIQQKGERIAKTTKMIKRKLEKKKKKKEKKNLGYG